jgi:hypothetical protein
MVRHVNPHNIWRPHCRTVYNRTADSPLFTTKRRVRSSVAQLRTEPGFDSRQGFYLFATVSRPVLGTPPTHTHTHTHTHAQPPIQSVSSVLSPKVKR